MILSVTAILAGVVAPAFALVPGLGNGQTGNLTTGKIPTLPAPLNGQDPLLPDYLSALRPNNTYDYVVVGAGTAGMVLAARLSEDPTVKVAVIEAGLDYTLGPIPVLNQELVNTPGADTVGCGAGDADYLLQAGVDWGFKTVPQAGCANREIRYARGKTIGGSSTRNFMLLQYPTVGSLDQWVSLTGDSSWSFKNRQADFKKVFKFTPPKHNLRQEIPAAQYNAKDWGSSSPLIQASYPNAASNFSHFMQLSCNEKGIPTTDSFNGGKLLGVQYCPTTINPNGGIRSTSRDAYVAASKRPNLKVYTGALAKRIILSNDPTPKATGVIFSSSALLLDRLGLFSVHATREVIVSAGAFNSPQLLMVSGIGPKDQLQAQNIPVRVENSNVGQNMEDHIFTGPPSYKTYTSTGTLTDVAANPLFLVEQFANFSVSQLGPLTNPVADLLAWERIPPQTATAIGADVLNSYPADWPHIELFSGAGFVGNFDGLFAENLARGADGSRFVSILPALVAPRSRGTVTLASSDTADLPIIDPRWLTDPVDQAAAVWAFKRTREIFSAKAMQPVLADTVEYYPGPQVSTDAQILQHVKENTMTVWHASATCKMAKKENGGVLDSQLRVYGVDSLRVVDASSFPSLPPGHPQSTCYMLGQRAADLILQAKSGKSVASVLGSIARRSVVQKEHL
ncbi:unnamed protein product [Parajaminaea phylloscopi]